MKLEVKVGVFFIVGLIILAVLTFKISDFTQLILERYEIHAKVKHAAGLQVGDPVAVAGVKVGTVKNLKLETDNVDLTLLIDKTAKIHKDALGVIAWSGLLGARYVDITMGAPASATLKGGDQLPMKEAYRPETLIDKLDVVFASVHDMMTGPSADSFKALPKKIDTALTSLTSVTEDLRSGKGTLGKLLTSDETQVKLEAAFKSVQEAADQVRDIAKKNSENIDKTISSLGDVGPQIKDAVANLNSILKDAKEGKGPFMKLLTDEKMATDLQDTITSLKAFSDKLQSGEGVIGRLSTDKALADDVAVALKNLKDVSDRLGKGEGTLGKLLTDEQGYQDFQKLMAEARDLLRSIKEQIPVGAFGSAISGAF